MKTIDLSYNETWELLDSFEIPLKTFHNKNMNDIEKIIFDLEEKMYSRKNVEQFRNQNSWYGYYTSDRDIKDVVETEDGKLIYKFYKRMVNGKDRIQYLKDLVDIIHKEHNELFENFNSLPEDIIEVIKNSFNKGY